MVRTQAKWLAGIAALSFVILLTAQRDRERERPARHSVRGTRAAVAAGSEASAEAGMRMLHKGGNAVDAGVAALFAAAVAEYSHFGFGGEAPVLIRTREGAVVSIAGVGTMPTAATADTFRNRRLQPGEVTRLEPGGLKSFVPVAGLMPALVPGMVEAALVALREYGTLSFAEVIAPAIELADGNPLDEIRAGAIAASRRFFELWPASKAVFLPGGEIPSVGRIFRQPDLARTLRSMVEAERRASKKSRTAGIDAVRDHFYRGEIARKIDSFVRAHDGLLRYEDMAAFRLKPEPALSTTYRGYTVYKPGFWTQGPVMLQALNTLEGLELGRMGHNSAEYIHTVIEALKLAYADRDTYYGDPAFVRVPAERLLSKEYAALRRGQIEKRASLEFRPGDLEGSKLHPSQTEADHVRIDDALMARDTTSITTADHSGLMFAVTPSGAWTPAVIAGDTGIPLTQRAQSFLLIRGHPNELAGGKRPRVTLSPTLVTAPNGKPFLAMATPGGDNQDQALLQMLLNAVEFGMDAQQAVEAPRVQSRHLVSSFDNHAMNRGDLLLDERIPADVFAALAGRGHKVSTRSRWGSGANPVIIRVTSSGVIEAGADPWGYRIAHAW